MKTFSKFGLAITAAALLIPSVSRADDAILRAGWYAGLDGIASLQTNADSKVKADGVKDNLKYSAGWGIGGEAGYAFGNGLRAEGEVSYRRSGTADSVSGPNAGWAGGHIRNIAVMANGFYDLNTNTRFTPYVGAGLGVSVVDAFALRTVDNRALDSENVAFAYQGIAGVSTAIDKNWSLTTDYRYFRTIDPDFKTSVGGRARTENASHNVVVGFRYAFGAPVAPVPAPIAVPAPMPAPAVAPVKTPAPVAAPAVPAVPQSFLVFFDFDRASLTPEAKRILASAAQEFKAGKYVRIVVTGHTDTTGSAKYDQKLSVKRAQAVQSELKRLGVSATAIQASGAGKSGLLVPTADGVREAQNRRAEIVLGR